MASLDDRLRAAIADDLDAGTGSPGIDARYLVRLMDPDDVIAVLETFERERAAPVPGGYFTWLVGIAVAVHPNRRAYEEQDDGWPGRR